MTAPDPLTLRELTDWSYAGPTLAVLGHPIKHSISPAMHNAALADLARENARFADWRYFRFEVHPDDLPRALELLHTKQFHGVNLTVPHKMLAFDVIAEIDAGARPVGAVNTLLRTDQGWRGFNTDGYGLASALKESLGLALTDRPIVLLGAGGAARGAAVECLQQGCRSLAIANRTPANLHSLLLALAPLAHGIDVRGFDPTAPPPDLPAGCLVINATSAGLRETDPLPIDLSRLPQPAAVFDMIYNPAATPLLRAAAARRLPCANGLAMLVHQGAKALEIWSGIPAPRTAPLMTTAAHAAMASRTGHS
ncbi:MAG: shikimate dehydrogenase [Verrucomicrobiota bacterium]|jgi:shikimate dehydrogenase